MASAPAFRVLPTLVLLVCTQRLVCGSPVAYLLNFPWQTNCYDCTGGSNYGVIELQSWLEYGVTEAQCRNVAAALDGNFTLNGGLTRNFFYTYAANNLYSSCAVALHSNCTEDVQELGQFGLIGNSSVFPTTYGDQANNACSKNSTAYFLSSNAKVLNSASPGSPLNQVTDNIQPGTVHPTANQTVLFGNGASSRRGLAAVNCNTPFLGWFKCVAPVVLPPLIKPGGILPTIVVPIITALIGALL